MPTLTQAAGEMLTQMLRDNEAAENQCIRLCADGSQLKMVIAEEQPEDTLLSHEEKVVLALEPMVAGQLEEATFDVKQTEEGKLLVVT